MRGPGDAEHRISGFVRTCPFAARILVCGARDDSRRQRVCRGGADRGPRKIPTDVSNAYLGPNRTREHARSGPSAPPPEREHDDIMYPSAVPSCWASRLAWRRSANGITWTAVGAVRRGVMARSSIGVRAITLLLDRAYATSRAGSSSCSRCSARARRQRAFWVGRQARASPPALGHRRSTCIRAPKGIHLHMWAGYSSAATT